MNSKTLTNILLLFSKHKPQNMINYYNTTLIYHGYGGKSKKKKCSYYT